MDVPESNLNNEQLTTLKLVSSVFPQNDVTEIENFFKTLVTQNSLPASKSPKKQATLDKWLVKKVSKPNENSPSEPTSTTIESPKEPQIKSTCEREQTPQSDVVNLKSSTSTILDGSSNNEEANELNLETSKKALTDTEILVMGMKDVRIVLHKIEHEYHQPTLSSPSKKPKKESSKSNVIQSSESTSPQTVRPIENESSLEKKLLGHSSQFHSSQSAPTKIVIRKTRYSNRNLNENSELISAQSNTEEQHSIVKEKDTEDIFGTPQQKSSPANKRILRKRKSSVNSDSSSIAEKVTIIEANFDSINKSANSLAMEMAQPVPAKQQICRNRRKSRTLSGENSHSLNLVNEDSSILKNYEGRVLQCETPKHISSFMNENSLKSTATDRGNSDSTSSSLPAVMSPNLVPQPEKTDVNVGINVSQPVATKQRACKSRRKSKTLSRENSRHPNLKKQDSSNKYQDKVSECETPMEVCSFVDESILKSPLSDKQKSTTVRLLEQSEIRSEDNKKPKTIIDGNQIFGLTERIKKSKGKVNEKSKKTKKSNKQSEINGKLNELLDTVVKQNILPETTEEAKDPEPTERGNLMPGKTTEDIEENSEVTVKFNKKSKTSKKSNKKLETSEKPLELQETGNASKESEKIAKTKKSLKAIKTLSNKSKKLHISKLVPEHSQVMDATSMETAEMDTVLDEAENEKICSSVDSKLTEQIGISEANPSTSTDSDCNAATAECDEKQKKYEAFCTMQKVCSSLGITIEQLSQIQKLKKKLKSNLKNEAFAFIQGHKHKNGHTTPSAYFYDNKEELYQKCRSEC